MIGPFAKGFVAMRLAGGRTLAGLFYECWSFQPHLTFNWSGLSEAGLPWGRRAGQAGRAAGVGHVAQGATRCPRAAHNRSTGPAYLREERLGLGAAEAAKREHGEGMREILHIPKASSVGANKKCAVPRTAHHERKAVTS